MRFRKQHPRWRSARFERLDSRHLLTAVIGDPKVVPAQPAIVDADWQLDIPGDRLDAEGTARSYLSTISGELGIRVDTNDLLLVEIKHGLASTHSRYQQALRGIPVHGSTITVNQGPDGAIQNYYSTTFPNLELPATASGGISFSTAEQLAREAAGVEEELLPSEGALVWLPFNDHSARLAWRIEVHALRPTGDFLTLIDAQTGQVYSQVNRVAFDSGSGDVFDPNPYQTQGSGTGLSDNNDANSPALTAQLVNVTLQGLTPGTGLLVGEFVDVSTLHPNSLPDANEPTRVYEYTRDDPRFEQVVIYHSIDQIQRYFHSLGFDGDNPIDNGIRDFPTEANAHVDNDDQSFYRPDTDAIYFGDGGVDDGEDADIIAHEYGHAVQHNQNTNWGGGEMGAMGEGFGDYLAASFYEQFGDTSFQSSHAACVGEWDATFYSSTNPPCLRRVDGNKQYVEYTGSSVHDDGEIWSAALWDMRTDLGATVTDTLVLEHHFGLPGNATMTTAANAIIAADANLNGGANEGAIRNAFCDRGILPSQDCTIAPGRIEGVKWNDLNGDGFRDGGEPLLPDWTIFIDSNQNGTIDSSSDTVPSSNVPVAIVDLQTVMSGIEVAGFTGNITDINVTLDITHTYNSDLTVRLEAPNGDRISLFAGVGTSQSNFTNTTLDDEATTPIGSGTAPFTGSFAPVQALSDFDGLNPNGTWTLSIEDDAEFDTGTLNSWSLTIEAEENSAITNANGEYVLSVKEQGTYTIAEVQQANWQQTFPASGTHLVTVGPGQEEVGIDFGNQSNASTSEVVARRLFYNNSGFDGNDPTANSNDAAAIADKLPLMAGETASFENISSFSSGINGVIIDIEGVADPLQLSMNDFGFRRGNDNDIGNWSAAPNPAITVDAGAGENGSDRLTLVWPDGTFVNEWIEIRVRATPETGLTLDDVFYFGNSIGETGNLPGSTAVDAADFLGVRQHQKNFLDPALVDDVFDINRDQRVNSADMLLVRDHQSAIANLLELITP